MYIFMGDTVCEHGYILHFIYADYCYFIYFFLSGFDDYFLKLELKTNRRNIWFKEYWEAMFNCTTKTHLAQQGKKYCDGKW